MFCSKCGADVPEGSSSCANCGSPVAASASAPPPQATPPQQMLPPRAAPAVTPPAPPPTEGKATASLILGILSLVCFSVLAGIPAVILGHMAQSNIRKSAGRLAGQGMATAGLIMGYLSIVSIPVILIIAAIAIPNLIRARIGANEAAAASSLRTINIAQVTYTTEYAGYARDLATLGSGPAGVCTGSGTKDHACLVDNALGCSSAWCTRSSYSFNVTGTDCAQNGTCSGYVAVAVPIAANTGRRRFCSTADAVIRSQLGGPMMNPPTADECQAWLPLSN